MTKRFTPLKFKDERLCLRIELRDMELLEEFNQPFGNMFLPMRFLETAPEMMLHFAKDINLLTCFSNSKEARAFVKEFADANPKGAYVGLAELHTHIMTALIDGGWIANPLEKGDIGAAKASGAPVEPTPMHKAVKDTFEPLLLGYGVPISEIERMTPIECQATIAALSKTRVEDLRNADLLNAGVMQAIVVSAGAKGIDREKLLTFQTHTPDNEHGYNYGPGETLVSEEMQEGDIEAIAHFAEMKRRMGGFCKKQ